MVRNDYKKLTAILEERVINLSCMVEQKMKELQIVRFENLEIVEFKTNLCSETRLMITCNSSRGARSLTDINSEYFLHGDYNCLIKGANSKEALSFLNNVKEILRKLQDKEDEQIQEIENALKNTEDLLN